MFLTIYVRVHSFHFSTDVLIDIAIVAHRQTDKIAIAFIYTVAILHQAQRYEEILDAEKWEP